MKQKSTNNNDNNIYFLIAAVAILFPTLIYMFNSLFYQL